MRNKAGLTNFFFMRWLRKQDYLLHQQTKPVLNGTITISIRDPFYTNPVNFSLNQGNISASGRREMIQKNRNQV
jgi:hypothetical protein